MSADDRSPAQTDSDESPKNTIRVFKTNDSDKTVVEVKVAGESAGKVTIFGGGGDAPSPSADDKDNAPDNSVKPLTQEEIDKIVARYAKMDEKDKKKFMDFFWSVDTFGFGAFTVHQLAYRLRSSGRCLSDKQITKIFTDLDQNNDMIVTLDEYLEEMSKDKPATARSEAEWRALFERADKNKDGFVCKQDIRDLLDEAGVKVTTPELADFMRKDSSGNGEKLGFQEFRRTMQSYHHNFSLY